MKKILKILLLIIVIIILAILFFNFYKNFKTDSNKFSDKSKENIVATTTYLYKNHGFSIELPKGYTPKEIQSEGGPSISISLPDANLVYVTNAYFWEKNVIPSYTYIREEKIGSTMFKVYNYGDDFVFYWFKQGNVGYEYRGNLELLKTFKFTGWQ